MSNRPSSAPPTIENVEAGPSASSAVTVVTAVAFSATETVAVSPPPFDVIAGVTSFTSVTFTVMV